MKIVKIKTATPNRQDSPTTTQGKENPWK